MAAPLTAPTEQSAKPVNRVNRALRAPAQTSGDDPITAPVPAVEVDRAKRTPRTRASRKERLAALGRKLRQVVSVLSVVGFAVGAAVTAREGHRWLVSTPRFSARDVVVRGNERATQEEILAAGNITTTRNVLSIEVERTARAIEELPWVAHARVTRRLPGHVEVEVEERAPVALVAAGGMYLVSADGTLFKRAVPGDPSDMPVVTGIDRHEFEQDPDAAREGVRDALALLADIDASSVTPRLRVDEVHREPTGDLSIVIEGTHVWLGKGPYRAKLTRLRVVLAELGRRGLTASEIHLESDRHPERVTVRPRRG
jgi:cell division septal protein FtsQ